MASFQGYARNNGFDPILIPDTSERDLREADRQSKDMQRAFDSQDKYKRAVLSQQQENQTLEAENRRQNFELNDKFIKENRAAEKRNFDIRINNLEKKEQSFSQLQKFAEQFSQTAVARTNTAFKEKRQAEQDNAMNLYFKYGVTTQERAEIDEIEGEINGMNAVTSPALRRLKNAGASTEELKLIANVSGYAELGANIAMAKQAGNNYSGYLGADRQKYKVGDEMMTLAQAISEGDELAVSTILTQQRINYINEAAPGMDPKFLDKYMFDSMRTVENTMLTQVRKVDRENFEANQKLQETREIISFGSNPQGARDLWDQVQLQMPGPDRGLYLNDKIKGIVSATEAGAISSELATNILDMQVSPPGNPNITGKFRDIYKNQAVKLEDALQNAQKRNLDKTAQDQRARDLASEQQFLEIKDYLFKGGNVPTNDQIEVAKNATENPDVRNKLENLKSNSTVEADADKRLTEDVNKAILEGRPVDEMMIRGYTSATADTRNQLLKKAKEANAINTVDAAGIKSRANALVQSKMGENYSAVGALSKSPTADAARRALYKEGLKAYKLKMENSDATPAEALAYAEAQIEKVFNNPDGNYTYTSLKDRVEGSDGQIFEGFLKFEGGGPTPMGDVRNYPPKVINQLIAKPDLINTQKLYDQDTLQEIADKYKEDGNLSRADLTPIYRLADKLPKATYLDVLNGQMKAAGIDWDLPDVLEKADMNDQNIRDAVRRLSYKPNRTQSRIAEVGLGKEPDINTDLNSVQQQATQIIADVESGQWGYNAVNQGTAPDGTILGSGSIGNIYPGMDLTQQTIGKVRAMQNENFSGSDAEWRASGGLWAVGKYQFIPSTLQMLMDKNNISPDTLFTPELQDYLALQLLTIQGPQAWIGVMENGRVKISQAKFNILQQAAQMQMPDFGPAPWRQPDTLDPAVVETYQNGL
tara:strand:- start:4241 stop:7045 length:2805 start_codon:yes stop_codon:yes gene_type:complete